MADPRLRWNDIAAPNLSQTSQILANANRSFNTGLDSASSILDKYNAGQQEKADNDILTQIAGLNSEEELATFLNSDALQGKNLSETMRANVLGLRKNIIGYGQDRANIANTQATTRNTNARTTIAQAAEGRTASEYADGVAAREEYRGLTPYVVGASTEGNQYGFTNDAPASLVRTESGGNFAAKNNETGSSGRKGHFGRVQFGRDRFDEAVAAGAVPQGMSIEEFGSNTPAAKAAQKRAEDWHFGDIQNFISRGKLDQYIGRSFGGTPITRDGMVAIAHLGGKGGLQRFLETGGLYDPADSNGTKLSDYAKTHAGNTTGGNRSGPQFDALQNAIAQSVYLSPDQASNLLTSAYAAQKAGQGRIDAASAAAQQEQSAASILAAVQNPLNTNASGVTSTLLSDTALGSAQDRLSAVQRADGLLANDGPLNSTLSPAVAPNTLLNATVEENLAAGQRSIDALPQTRIMDRAAQYESNPTEALINELNLGNDGNDPQTFLFGLLGENFDEVEVTRKINDIARAAGVTPAMAAAGMVEKFRRDPFRNNTLDRRFVEDEVVGFIKDTMSPEALQRYNNARISQERKSGETQGAQIRLRQLQTQAQKFGANVPPQIANEISQLRDTLATGATPQEAEQRLQSYIRDNGMAARLKGLDPNSIDYDRAILELENYIQIDPNLTSKEKELLLLSVRG